MSEPSDKKPKKRGRKPKNVIIAKKKEDSDKVTIPENLIIKLQESSIMKDNVVAYDDSELSDIKGSTVSEVCWNCCHSFDGLVHGIPLKYVHKVFYVYGDFCSLECGSRYCFDHLKDFNFSDIFTLINLYNNIVYDTHDIIGLAPNRLLLKMFGGPQTIEEYRENFKKKNVYDIKLPPIFPINHNIDTYETNNNANLSNLKLYRKKPLPSEKKSITSSMKLIIENNNE
jgi:hypothetical protein